MAQVSKRPNDNWLGTRVGDKYEWTSWKDAVDLAKNLSFGFAELGLCPSVNVKEKSFKFMGIKSKNRKEWYLTHIANIC